MRESFETWIAEVLYCVRFLPDRKAIRQELEVLEQVFRAEPDYGKLLRSANLSKAERCGILDEALRERVHPYLLNFLKILVEKGYIGSFDQ